MLTPGPPTWELRTVDTGTVEEINLRTYASALQSIYGPTQQVLQDVRTDAKRNRFRLAELRPRLPESVICERTEK
jgi:hypothetical protein